MKLDPELASLIKWLLGGIGWLVSIVTTYIIGKRGKVDDLKISRRHELIEKLSISLQEDYDNREILMKQFQNNFDHITERAKAYEAFENYQTLYTDMRALIDKCSQLTTELHSLSREIAIYVKEDLHNELKKYIDSTNFKYTDDGGIGLICTYYPSFFENLLDESNVRIRRESFSKILKKLRNTRH